MCLKLVAAGIACLPLMVVAAPGIQQTSSYKVGDDTYINKYLDLNEGVVCYVLKPVALHYSQDLAGNRGYDGNSVGSLSCLKIGK